MNESGLNIETSAERGCIVVRVQGKTLLDEADARRIRQTVEEATANEEAPRVVLSLKGAKVVASSAWSKFMMMDREMARRGGAFVLIDVDDALLEVLETMKIRKLLDIRPSVEAAAEKDYEPES